MGRNTQKELGGSLLHPSPFSHPAALNADVVGSGGKG